MQGPGPPDQLDKTYFERETEMYNMGTGGHPFPHMKQSEALRKEDAFMQLHGGTGCRWIYGVVEALSAGKNAARRVLDMLVKVRSDKTASKYEHDISSGFDQSSCGVQGPKAF